MKIEKRIEFIEVLAPLSLGEKAQIRIVLNGVCKDILTSPVENWFQSPSQGIEIRTANSIYRSWRFFNPFN